MHGMNILESKDYKKINKILTHHPKFVDKYFDIVVELNDLELIDIFLWHSTKKQHLQHALQVAKQNNNAQLLNLLEKYKCNK